MTPVSDIFEQNKSTRRHSSFFPVADLTQCRSIAPDGHHALMYSTPIDLPCMSGNLIETNF
jgi:hypothetical protein